MDFVLLDQTNGTPTHDGSVLTFPVLRDIAAACEIQLNRDASPEYGGSHRVRAGESQTDVQPGEHVHAIQPDLKGAPGAIAFHDVTGRGVPFSLDGISLNDSLTASGNSLAVSTSHELLEILGNPGINKWCADGKGMQNAFELCDAVEQQSYAITLINGHVVFVSNFVLQNFFIVGAPPPYDYLSTVTNNGSAPPGPFLTAPGRGGNYQIVASQGTGQHTINAMGVAVLINVTFEGRVARPEKARHWSSRTYQLGARI